MASSYTLPSGKDELTGACAFDGGLCTWTGRTAHLWRPDAGWTALSEAPTTIDSGFKLQSGVLAGTDTHVGFLPSGSTDWAGWVNLSSFSNAHPMYGDLLLCTDASSDTYTLFSVSASGLDPISGFKTDELADPAAGWSAPTNPERLLLLGDGGLWALSPPYTASALQHLVSFDDVELPSFQEIPGPFQPGVATVVIPRRTRTALRVGLSDGTGEATGLAHLSGSAALWSAYLEDDRTLASRLLTALATLPAAPNDDALRLHDILVKEESIQALATSAGLLVPSEPVPDAPSTPLTESPLPPSILATWGLWLDWDGALETACRCLCNAAEPNYALAESLRVFAEDQAVQTLFDLLRSEEPPTGPDGRYAFPAAVLRSVVASAGKTAASLVSSNLAATSIPARVAACLAAGALPADRNPDASSDTTTPAPTLWTDDHPLPEEFLRSNTTHDHPAVRAAARDTCARLAIEEPSSTQASS
jgi:hypothetical protein